jgi:carboxylesterase
MTDYPPPVPDPFDYPGNDVGVLMIHGFTSSPAELRLMGQYLAAQAYTVLGPLLPGHGTRWQDMAACTWRDWTSAVERAYQALRVRCRTVFVVGSSMGGLLTLYLAERHPEIPAIVPMAPAVFAANLLAPLAWLFKYFVRFLPYDPAKDGDDLTDPEARQRYLWSYSGTPVAAVEQLVKLQRVVRPALRKIACPTLILHGMHDSTIKPSASQYVYDHIASQDKQVVWLHNSGHCLWVDSEKEQVFQRIHHFLAERTPLA